MHLSVEDFQAIALTLQLASVTTVLLLLLAMLNYRLALSAASTAADARPGLSPA